MARLRVGCPCSLRGNRRDASQIKQRQCGLNDAFALFFGIFTTCAAMAQPICAWPVAWRCAADGVVALCNDRLGSGCVVQVTCQASGCGSGVHMGDGGACQLRNGFATVFRCSARF